jgi:hypothetical protein
MKKPLRIIFLDLDGVMNNEGSFKGAKMDPIDPHAIKLLNELVRDTDSCIVISSAWRIGNPLHLIQVMMAGVGFEFPERIIGATMDISDKTNGGIWVTKNRGQEIALWLNQVDVDSFVILDDDADMDPVMDRLVKTTFDTGLQKEHIEQAKKILLND